MKTSRYFTQMLNCILLLVICLFTFAASTLGQFSSGSTGADGALDTSTMNCPGTVCRVQLPESGILNYTTINAVNGRFLYFAPNSRNTPVILLAQGDVNIGGEISVSAPCTMGPPIPCSDHTPSQNSIQIAGNGGFSGGAYNRNGFGPGGAVSGSNDTHGRWVGPLSLVPIVGGSGGAGYVCGFPIFACLGSGGGGAILIASSTSISVSGTLRANAAQSGAPGGGGAIRLVANSINVSGLLEAKSYAYHGVIRFESPSITFTGSAIPLPVQSQINPVIVPSAAPRLSISSVGGVAVPSNSGQRTDWIDVLINNQVPDPVPVGVSAQNIPVGTQIQVGFVSGSPNGTSTPCNLAGTFSSSSCTATISNLNRSGGTYLLATAMFDPPASLAKFNPKGPNQVVKVKLESVLGANPKYLFLRSNGTVIENAIISKEFLKEFGM